MVSGRQETEVLCSKCGKPWLELNLADRQKRICTACISDVPLQMSLFSRALTPKLQPTRKQSDEPIYVRCEACLKRSARLLEFLNRLDDKSFAWVIWVGQTFLNPTKQPFYGGRCFECWPPGSADDWYEKWREHNPKGGRTSERV